jgi:hypothetical protein
MQVGEKAERTRKSMSMQVLPKHKHVLFLHDFHTDIDRSRQIASQMKHCLGRCVSSRVMNEAFMESNPIAGVIDFNRQLWAVMMKKGFY